MVIMNQGGEKIKRDPLPIGLLLEETIEGLVLDGEAS